MVVFIHSSPSINVLSSAPMEQLRIFLRQCLNLAVPLFIAISGYLCAVKQRDAAGCRAFLHRQFRGLYVPTLIWSVPYPGPESARRHQPAAEPTLVALCGCSIYYFIAVILQYYALSRFLIKLTHRGGVILSALISIGSVVLITWLTAFQGVRIFMVFYAGMFLFWLVFFVIGLYFGRYPQARQSTFWAGIVIMVVGLWASMAETHWLSQLKHNDFMGYKLSAFVMASGAICLLFSSVIEKRFRSESVLSRLLAYLGRNSLGIYLIHCYWISAVVRLWNNVNWLVKGALAIFLSVMTIKIVKRYLPRIAPFLGFR